MDSGQARKCGCGLVEAGNWTYNRQRSNSWTCSESSPMTGVIQNVLLFCLSCFQDVPIEVQQLTSPQPQQAVWRGIDAEKMTIQVGGQAKTIPIQALQSVQFATQASSKNSGIVVTMADGSTIYPSQLISNSQAVQLTLSASSQVSIPAASIASVQLQELNEKQAKQWQTIQESRIAGDTLVVIRSADAVDKIEGSIVEINAERVVFEFNKQKVEAPRAKLAGLRFLAPPAKLQRVGAVVTDILGNAFKAAKIATVSPGNIELSLACGAKVELPLSQLKSIDFSVGSVKYVAELTPLAQKQAIALNLKTPIAGAEQLLGPQTVTIPQSSGPSIKMLGSGSVTYRVPQEYVSLAGRVYLAPEGEQFTACSVEIRQENDVVWKGRLNHPNDRLEVSAKIVPESRLQLVVSAEGSYPVGDVVVWQELRMMK